MPLYRHRPIVRTISKEKFEQLQQCQIALHPKRLKLLVLISDVAGENMQPLASPLNLLFSANNSLALYFDL